jgi:aspartate aminotransferase-like enzyme
VKLFVFPGNLSAEVRAAGAAEVPYARTASFGSLVCRCHQRLATLAGADDGEVISFTASATGAAECLLGGWGPQWDNILILHAGTFGERWLTMARHLGLGSTSLRWPPHDEPPWEEIAEALASGRHQAVMAVHHETSSGELLDLERLGAICRTHGVRLLVDAIGSFLADDFAMARWGVDAAILSSQKGLCLPPGLAFLIMRPALGPPAPHSLSYYFDPQRHRENFARGQAPWSPAAQLYAQLACRLDTLDTQSGAGPEQARVRKKASAFRAAIAAQGWHGAARQPSACVTALRFNGSTAPLVQALAEQGWLILPSPDEKLVRIAHLGENSVADHEELAQLMGQQATLMGMTMTSS